MPIEIALYLVMLLFTITISLKKATIHFTYLREVKPEFLRYTSSYFASFHPDGYNVSIQLLLLPFMKSYPKTESFKAMLLRKKVHQHIILTWVGVVVLILEYLYVLLNA